MPLPKTVKKNRTSWRPSWPSSARPQLHDLSADDVRQSLAAGYSTAAVSMSTSRSSAPSGTPKPTTWWPATSPPWPTPPRSAWPPVQVPHSGSGRGGHHRGPAPCAGPTSTWTATPPPPPVPPHIPVWRSVRPRRHRDRTVTPRPRPPRGRGRGRGRSAPWPTARPASGSEPGMNGRTPAGLHYLPRRRPRRRGTSGRCSNGSVPKPETNGHPRAADLLRQPDEPPRRQYRGDRPPRRTRLYLHHRDRLPPRAPVTRSIPRPR
jgi:hypothetical protein